MSYSIVLTDKQLALIDAAKAQARASGKTQELTIRDVPTLRDGEKNKERHRISIDTDGRAAITHSLLGHDLPSESIDGTRFVIGDFRTKEKLYQIDVVGPRASTRASVGYGDGDDYVAPSQQHTNKGGSFANRALNVIFGVAVPFIWFAQKLRSLFGKEDKAIMPVPYYSTSQTIGADDRRSESSGSSTKSVPPVLSPALFYAAGSGAGAYFGSYSARPTASPTDSIATTPVSSPASSRRPSLGG